MELHGRLPLEAQRRALRPDPEGRRVVLATAIAESSVTVDGVRLVVDAGQERLPVFQPRSGLTRLETRRVNRASADQRRGRAGRQGPGLCLRLWAEEQPLVPHGEPEIRQADLAPLAFELARWGITDPASLAWVTPPPAAALAAGRDLLHRLGLLDDAFHLTELGRSAARWPTHPRLATMLERAFELDAVALACALVALLEERSGDEERDLERALQSRLREPRRYRQWCRDAERLARIAGVPSRWRAWLRWGSCWPSPTRSVSPNAWTPRAAFAWLLGDWRPCPRRTPWPTPSCWWPPSSPARRAGRGSSGRWRWMSPGLRRSIPSAPNGGRISSGPTSRAASSASRCAAWGPWCSERRPLQRLPAEAVREALLEALRRRGLPRDESLTQLRGRLALLRGALGDDWPDASEEALLATLASWLGPHLDGITRLEAVGACRSRVCCWIPSTGRCVPVSTSSPPERLTVPSGARHQVDYAPCLEDQPPVLAVKLQECFGWHASPLVADGRVAVLLHLLSPARRPLQVTADLASFWAGGYAEVRREMRGRYPKHPWPADPATAEATARTKRR